MVAAIQDNSKNQTNQRAYFFQTGVSASFFLSRFLLGRPPSPKTFPVGVTSFTVLKLVVCLMFPDLSHSLRSSVVSVITVPGVRSKYQ